MENSLPPPNSNDHITSLEQREKEEYLFDRTLKRIKNPEEKKLDRVMMSLFLPLVWIYSMFGALIDFFTEGTRDIMEEDGIIARVPLEYRTKQKGEAWVQERCDAIYAKMDDRFLGALHMERLEEIHATTAYRTKQVIQEFHCCLEKDLLSPIEKKSEYDPVRTLHASHVYELKGFMDGVRKMYDNREILESKLTIYAPLLREEFLYERVKKWTEINFDKGLTIIIDMFVRVREVDEYSDRKGTYASRIADSYVQQFDEIITGIKTTIELRNTLKKQELELNQLRKKMDTMQGTPEEKREVVDQLEDTMEQINKTQSRMERAIQKATEKLHSS